MKIIKHLRLFAAYSLALTLSFISSTYAESYNYDDTGRLTGITYDDGSMISYTYDSRGNLLQSNITTVEPDIMVAPATHDFGTVDVGSVSTSQTITISNVGTSDLVVSAIDLIGTDVTDFILTIDTCPSLSPTIGASSNCTITVNFSPLSIGSKTATLRIASNDSDTPNHDVALSGAGQAVLLADITVDPASADFGSITVNDTSAAQTFTVSNIGNSNLIVASMTIAGADAAEFSVVEGTCVNLTPTLTPSENCTVEVRFLPTAPGTKTASLDITSNDPDTPTINLPLSATGTALANASPDSFALVFPADGATDLPASIPLIWKQTTDPDGDTVSYQVIFCDNAAFTNCSAQTVAVNTQDMILVASIAGPFTGLFMLGLVFTGSRKTRIKKQLAFIAILVFVSGLAACGGGGGSDPDPDPGLPTAATDEKQLDIGGLAAATTYFWKVTADDGKGGLTDSATRSFTTQ